MLNIDHSNGIQLKIEFEDYPYIKFTVLPHFHGLKTVRQFKIILRIIE
jgi:hypothetical protein